MSAPAFTIAPVRRLGPVESVVATTPMLARRSEAADSGAAVMREQAPTETDGRAGRKSLGLLPGTHESARTGRDVPLPLRVRH